MYRIRQSILLFGDVISLYLGLYLGVFLRYFSFPEKQFLDLINPMSFLFLFAIVLFFIVGMYDLSSARNSWKFFQKIIIISVVWILIGIIFFYIYPQSKLLTPKTILLLTALCGFGIISIWRFLHNKFLSTIILKTNIIFIGLPKEALEIIKVLKKNPELGYNIIGAIDPNNTQTELNIKIDNSLEKLNNNTQNKNTAHIIIISPEFNKNENLLNELYKKIFEQVEIIDLAQFYEEITGRIPPFTFSESWFLTNLHEQQKKIFDRFRTLIDYAISIVLFVFFLFILPFVALAIKLNSKGSVFFKQNRVGKNGKIFQVYKFRTMKSLSSDGSAEINGPQFAEEKDLRITTVGNFLRKTRIDEIPQFINILKGEMSIVGPRPERPEFVKELTDNMPFYSLRHIVKPGLTGWAQLQQGYYGTINENLQKLEYDLYYIKNRNTILDIIIVLKTINILIKMMGR